MEFQIVDKQLVVPICKCSSCNQCSCDPPPITLVGFPLYSILELLGDQLDLGLDMIVLGRQQLGILQANVTEVVLELAESIKPRGFFSRCFSSCFVFLIPYSAPFFCLSVGALMSRN